MTRTGKQCRHIKAKLKQAAGKALPRIGFVPSSRPASTAAFNSHLGTEGKKKKNVETMQIHISGQLHTFCYSPKDPQ